MTSCRLCYDYPDCLSEADTSLCELHNALAEVARLRSALEFIAAWPDPGAPIWLDGVRSCALDALDTTSATNGGSDETLREQAKL